MRINDPTIRGIGKCDEGMIDYDTRGLEGGIVHGSCLTRGWRGKLQILEHLGLSRFPLSRKTTSIFGLGAVKAFHRCRFSFVNDTVPFQQALQVFAAAIPLHDLTEWHLAFQGRKALDVFTRAIPDKGGKHITVGCLASTALYFHLVR